MLVRAMLSDMSLVSYTGGVLTLACDERIRTTAENRLTELSQLVSTLAGTRVSCILSDAPVLPASADAPGAPVRPAGEIEIDDPVIRHAIQLFNGRIVEVKPLAPAQGDTEGNA